MKKIIKRNESLMKASHVEKTLPFWKMPYGFCGMAIDIDSPNIVKVIQAAAAHTCKDDVMLVWL